MTDQDILRMLDQEIARRRRGPERDGVDHRNQYNLGGTEVLEGFRRKLADAMRAELDGKVQGRLDIGTETVAIRRIKGGPILATQPPMY